MNSLFTEFVAGCIVLLDGVKWGYSHKRYTAYMYLARACNTSVRISTDVAELKNSLCTVFVAGGALHLLFLSATL